MRFIQETQFCKSQEKVCPFELSSYLATMFSFMPPSPISNTHASNHYHMNSKKVEIIVWCFHCCITAAVFAVLRTMHGT